jgi:hypothetical protein
MPTSHPQGEPNRGPGLKDHFPTRAALSAQFRPPYPEPLFAYLAKMAPARLRAWDCATGSGQAAAGLARYFAEVVATDASLRRVVSAAPETHFAVAFAEASAQESKMHSRQDRPHAEGAWNAIVARALKILGLGDAEGRRIFLLVLGQELTPRLEAIRAEIEQQMHRPARSVSTDLAEVAQRAGDLRETLGGLSESDKAALLGEMAGADRFGHGYDEAYLEALGRELDRLVAGCAAILTPPEPSIPDILPLRELIGVLAKAYAECFETEPDVSTDGPFARLLATIFFQVGINAPVTGELLEAGLDARRSLTQ